MYTEQLSQALSLGDKIDPSVATPGTVNSTGIDTSKGRRFMYEIQVGTVVATGTLDAKLQSAAAANFATPHNITGGAITQVTTTGARVTLEISDEAIQQLNPGDRYLRLQVIVGTANVTYGASGWVGEAEHKPASLSVPDIAAVSQRLVVT